LCARPWSPIALDTSRHDPLSSRIVTSPNLIPKALDRKELQKCITKRKCYAACEDLPQAIAFELLARHDRLEGKSAEETLDALLDPV
jgi:hypothetical protein